MSGFSDAALERLRGAIDIVDVVEKRGVELRKVGAEHVGSCCFHEERTPSLGVNQGKGTYLCRGCGAGGDAIGFVMSKDGLDFRAAAEQLADRYGVVLDDDAPGRSAPRPKQTDRAQSAPRPVTIPGKELSDGAMERLAALRGWTSDAVRDRGLRLQGDRVVIPLRDEHRKDAGYLTYQPNPAKRSEQHPKLMAGAGASRMLYPAPETITGDPLWIVEGEPDSIAARSIELPAVSIPGTNGWKKEWAARFARRRVVICFDCDESGRTAARQVAEDLALIAAEVRIVDLGQERNDHYDLSNLVMEGRDTPDQVRGILHDLAGEAPRVGRDGGRHAHRIERWQQVLTEIVDGEDDDAKPIPLPFERLNQATYGGLRPGELVIVAGYTSHGKSVLADMVLDHAADAGHRCHLYMTEMTLRDRGERLLARHSTVPFGKIRHRDLDAAMRAELRQVIADLNYGATLAADWKVPEVCEDIARCGWDLAVVDLLHGFQYDGERELTDHVRALAAAARASTEHGPGTCVVLCCHLNDRQIGINAASPKPGKQSLKGASSIRQDADTIILTWLEEDENGVAGTDGEIWIAKGRNSAGRNVHVKLDVKRMRFVETATMSVAA